MQNVTTTPDGVRVEGSGLSFDGSYVIAADGINSRVAEVMGFNKERAYHFNLYSLSWYMSGVETPEPNVAISSFGFPEGTVAMLFLVPRATEGEHNFVVISHDPRLDLEVAADYFMKRESCASWFKGAKKLRAFSAVNNIYSPIIEPYKDRVLVAGDVGATLELEITGAMISGWKAGQTISTAVQEENLGLDATALSQYANWWKETYINCYQPEAAAKMFALPYALATEEAMDYVFGLIREILRPCYNPYTAPIREALARVVPIIQQDKPELFQKLQRAELPTSQLFAELIKLSKPVS